ncbi:2,3-bisphosphoglycerate-independent phosphoglycerate mutase [Pediococcus argentinicus]|uniref:2,3-bisphosphoglycerate-independent phosphoglycerate mutase n=2 Tax=Pediococcus argentinicus TaxID=480391 RepID=A0A0R2NI01_9LACO|nr:2,3-bisphosphoglycerate-independent phosphoglycerate mutase [Pediococcus argentinicus]
MQGWADTPLTPAGIEQVTNAADKVANIKFDKYYSSDLLRAVSTAEIFKKENVNTNSETHKTIQVPELREACFGYFEGADGSATWSQICRPLGYPGIDEFLSEHTFLDARDIMSKADPFKDAENSKAFTKRIRLGLKKLIDKSDDQDTICVISHGDAIRTIIQMLDPSIDVHLPIKNGSINIITYKEGKFFIDAYNK